MHKNEIFAHLEKNPLTTKQYEACASQARTTLVLAGAGTGKTSTLMGRIVYLWEKGLSQAHQILPLAFAVDAAHEIQSRIEKVATSVGGFSLEGFQARTFHSLGLYIVSAVEGQRPLVSTLIDENSLLSFFQMQFSQLRKEDLSYREWLYQYYTFYDEQSSWRTLNDDYVLNQTELRIANRLYFLGISYCYHAHYEKDIYLDKPYQPYCCTFYLPDRKLYIDVLDCKETELSLEQQQRQQKLNNIHQHYGTNYQIFYADDEVMFEPSTIYTNPMLSHSVGRMDSLLKLLINLFLYLKSMGYSSQWLKTYLQENQIHSEEKAFPLLKQYCLYALLYPLWQAYEDYLKNEKSIDFDGMINKAKQYIKEGRFIVPWQDILIDEFQDISLARLQLIQAMREQNPTIRLFCVGDDWQTIYQFAGSELTYIRDIAQYFGEVKVVSLDTTFRFHQQLGDISSTFVQQNPRQYQKELRSFDTRIRNSVFLVPQNTEHKNIETVFAHVLYDLQIDAPQTCLILARFNHQLPDEMTLNRWQTSYPLLLFRCASIHASKGTEADIVIIVDVNSGEEGLPSEKQDRLALFKRKEETFLYAEERRVFYVALTRARERVYLCYDAQNISPFIEEIQQRHAFIQCIKKSNDHSIKKQSWVKWFSGWRDRLMKSLEK
ncbi:UvrD-helicase domain-containing protein [Pelistega sp. NLN82]|uniref:DNA 3'-5' helicase n=1 Tax=Pelistega ratti TaxID=2652177 RepID=A0A6L9Y4Y0_9BURK|nr:UvrD-helicase domain-containing protein [Pelistega ratti]NEN75439.1 UvrD-helicase domain-containing protein [Pelistega ratti]